MNKECSLCKHFIAGISICDTNPVIYKADPNWAGCIHYEPIKKEEEKPTKEKKRR